MAELDLAALRTHVEREEEDYGEDGHACIALPLAKDILAALERIPDLEAEVKGLWDEGQALIRDLQAYASEINDLRARCERQMEQLARAQRVEEAARALLAESELIFLSCNDPDDEDTPWPATIVNLRAALAEEGDRG